MHFKCCRPVVMDVFCSGSNKRPYSGILKEDFITFCHSLSNLQGGLAECVRFISHTLCNVVSPTQDSQKYIENLIRHLKKSRT